MDTDKIDIWSKQYSEVCSTYRATDTLRTSLLGLLPFGSLLGGVLILVNKDQVPPQYLPTIAKIGVAITFGLGIYEVHGILKCHRLIRVGKELERKLELDKTIGQFLSQPQWLGVPVERGFIGVPLSSFIIYVTVLVGWICLAFAVS